MTLFPYIHWSHILERQRSKVMKYIVCVYAFITAGIVNSNKPHAVTWCACLFLITFEHTWKASAILGVAISASVRAHVHPLSRNMSLRILKQAIVMYKPRNMTINLCSPYKSGHSNWNCLANTKGFIWSYNWFLPDIMKVYHLFLLIHRMLNHCNWKGVLSNSGIKEATLYTRTEEPRRLEEWMTTKICLRNSNPHLLDELRFPSLCPCSACNLFFVCK